MRTKLAVFFTFHLFLLCGLVAADEVRHAGFERAYFLETHARDFERAAVAYQEVLQDPAIGEAVRAEAVQRLADCRESVAATDLAKLFPSNAIAYAETNEPGKHIGRLAELLGLTEQSDSPGASGAIELDDGFAIPLDFTVSPALLNELAKIRGAALALTSLDFERDIPAGLLVLNAGSSDLVRGVLETGIQLVFVEMVWQPMRQEGRVSSNLVLARHW